jgi:hypothetical protein
VTVAELIEQLAQMPPDAEVSYNDCLRGYVSAGIAVQVGNQVVIDE